MAEKTLEEKKAALRARLEKANKSEQEINDALDELELDFMSEQEVLVGVATDGVKPVVIGGKISDDVLIDGVKFKREEIMQYLENPQLILDNGGSQEDYNRWVSANGDYQTYIKGLQDSGIDIGYDQEGIDGPLSEVDVSGDVQTFVPGTMVPQSTSELDRDILNPDLSNTTINPTKPHTTEDKNSKIAGEMLTLTVDQQIQRVNDAGIDTPEQRNEELNLDIAENLKNTVQSTGFTTPNNINWENPKDGENYGKKLFTNFLDNDPFIRDIQESVLNKNTALLDAKKAELVKKLDPFIVQGKYFRSFDIGYWDKIAEIENEYSVFANKLILADPAFQDRVERWEGQYTNMVSPFIEEVIKKENREKIINENSLFNPDGSPMDVSEMWDKIWSAEPGDINDLGLGLNSDVLLENTIYKRLRGFDSVLRSFGLEANIESSSRYGLQMLSLDKHIEALKFNRAADAMTDLSDWILSQEELDSLGPGELPFAADGEGRESKKHLLYKGYDTPVFYNTKTGEIRPTHFQNNKGEWKKLSGLINPVGKGPDGEDWEEIKFGDAKTKAEKVITQFTQDAGEWYGQVIDKEVRQGNWDTREFTDFWDTIGKGNIVDAALFIPEVILKQLPYMAATRLSYGLYTIAMEGGNIASDRLRAKASESLNIPLDKLSGDQIIEWMEANPIMVDRILGTSMVAGTAIAGAEYASAGFILKQSKYAFSGMKEMLKGNIRQGLKQYGNSYIYKLHAALVESGTEGLQTGIEQFTKGKFNAMEYVNAMGEGFVGGWSMTGLGGAVSGTITSIKDLVISTRMNIKDPKLYKKIQTSFKEKEKKIEDDFNKGLIDNDQRQQKLQNLSNERSTLLKLPFHFSAEAKNKAFDLLNRKAELENEIENQGPELAADAIEELKLVIDQINDLSIQEAINKKVARVKLLVDDSNGMVKMRSFKTNKGAENFIKKQNESGKWSKVSDSKDMGTIFQNDETGEQLIVVNEAKSRNLRDIAVADHEFLHAVLFQTVKNNPEAATAMGKALLNYLEQIDTDGLMSASLKERYEEYKNKPVEDQYEEALTFLADALINGEITLNESWGDKVGNVIRNLLGRLGINARFKTGKDVFNFVKDYAKASQEGKALNKAFRKLASGKSTIGIGENLGKGKQSQSTISSIIENQAGNQISGKSSIKSDGKLLDKLTKQYQKDRNALGEDLSTLYEQYVATSLAALEESSRKNKVPWNQIDKREAVSLIGGEFESIMRNYREINPVTGQKQSVSNYLYNIMGDRVGSILTAEWKRKQQQVSQDVLTEKGISPEVSTQEDFDAPGRQDKRRSKKTPSTLPSVRNIITGEILTDILGGKNTQGRWTGVSKDILNAMVGSVNPIKVAKSLIAASKNKTYRALLKGEQRIKDTTGKIIKITPKGIGKFGSESYNRFVDKIVDEGLNTIIPISTIKRRFKDLFKVEKVKRISETKVDEKGKKTSPGPYQYKMKKPSKQEMKDYFKSDEKKSQSLFSLLAEGLMVENISKLKDNKEYMSKIADTLSLKDPSFDTKVKALEAKQKIELDKLKKVSNQRIDKVENLKDLHEQQIKDLKIELAENYLDDIADQLDQRNKEDASLDITGKASSRSKPITSNQNNNLIKLGQAQDFHDAALILDDKYVKTPVKERDLNNLYQRDIDLVTQGQLGTAVLIASGLGNFGRVRQYGKLKNGKLETHNPVTGNKYSKDDEGVSKFYKLKNGGWAKAGTQAASLEGINKGNFLPQTGVYYSKKDPAYENLVKESEKYNNLPLNKKLAKYQIGRRIGARVKIPRNKRIKKKFLKDNKAQLDANKEALRLYVKILDKAHNELKVPLESLIPLVAASYQATEGLIKIAAGFKGVSKRFLYGKGAKYSDPQGKEVVKYREEHNPPASYIGASILWGIKYDHTDKVLKGIDKNYYQTQLSKLDDWRLDNAGYGATILDGTTILDDHIGLARFAAAGINLNTLIDPLTGKILVESEMGLGLNYIQAQNSSLRHYQNELVMAVVKGEISLKKAQEHLKVSIPVNIAKNARVKFTSLKLAPTIMDTNMTGQEVMDTMKNSLTTRALALGKSSKRKGISVFDFDDTIAKTKEKVIVNMPYYAPGRMDEATMELTPAEFAERAVDLEKMGASFDFSQFEDVKNAQKGPLADLALKRQDKFGGKDIFILTARPQASAPGIKMFLDGIGLNIPIENITGLEDGNPQAKARWILDKTKDGYNDFYFADDTIQNVKAVKQILDQIDVKSKVQQAKSSKRKKLGIEFNRMLQDTTGKEEFKSYSKARAQLEGQQKDKGIWKGIKRTFTITPSADDFLGLMYSFAGKGDKGTQHLEWIHDNLIDPYNKAEQELISAKVSAANDFNALVSKFPSLRRSKVSFSNPLEAQIGVGPFTKSHAVRVYIWSKQGMEIPGLSKTDQARLIKAVEADSELNVFADEILLIQRTEKYPKPRDNWQGGTLATDIERSIDIGLRGKVLAEWEATMDAIFTDENMNKIEALYGSRFREALEDSMRRMKSGSNRPVGSSRPVDLMLNWLNGSVGAVMFLNMRSGLLQLTSAINFINWGDNNILAASKAFASKAYFPTVMKLMNSDYLVNRRDGLKINVNEAELAAAAKRGGMQGMISYLLDKGFIITRIMDTLAIATGGASFFINRVKTYEKQGLTKAEAESKAFDDFYKIAEETQQSSNPSKISQQQAGGGGRVILSFQNVTMQYNRKTKKAIQNLYNRRKIPGMTQRESDLSHLSQIIYYTTIQNIIFHALQQTLFAMLFNDDEEEEEKNRIAGVANGMIDSLLFGLGFGGAAISTVKNILLELGEQHGKDRPKYEEAVWAAFDISPVLDKKVRGLRSGFRTFSWEKEAIRERGWSLDNPAYLAVGQIVAAFTNIPLDRVARKTMNLRAAMDEETRTWQRVALIAGWDTWSVGLPYWGLESTINREKKDREKAKNQYIIDRDRIKNKGFIKSDSKETPDGELGKDYYALEKWTGVLEYWVKGEPKKTTKKYTLKESKTSNNPQNQKQYDSIRAKKKVDQIKTLSEFGLTKEEIKALKYEKDRIEKILELMQS